MNPGCVNKDLIFPNNKLTSTEIGLQLSREDQRALLAVTGAWFQHISTGTGPIDNIFANLADLGHATIFTVSVRCRLFLVLEMEFDIASLCRIKFGGEAPIR
ncbi:hypothetical protein SAY86_008455 [Trapa natans]|uniref:Uncharacterized protein n=1 Tax=Trapa natans TaxID=22666 RepID=A0AAN7KA75_TRANT|nr:hypothetical protein SAY86_008455 [Trapa natans]